MRHTNKPSMYMIWQYESMHNVREKERVRESGSIAKIKICFEVRAHSSTSPPSHRGFPLTRPHRTSYTGNLRWGFGAITIGSTRLLSPTNTTSTLRGKAQSQTTITISSTFRGIPNQSPPLTRGSQIPLPLSPHTWGIITQSPLTRGISQRWWNHLEGGE